MRCRHPVYSWLGAFLCLALASCGEAGPLRVGYIGGLTGRAADLGVSGRNAVMLAVEGRNAAGGVRGRKVELLVGDDAQDPDAAKRVFRDLVQKRVELVIGPMTSSMASVLVPIANETKTLLISPTVTTTELAGRDDQFLRLCATTREYAGNCARHVLDATSWRRAAMVYDEENRAYTEDWLRDFRTPFEAGGGQIGGAVKFQSKQSPRFSELAAKAIRSRPDFVVVIANTVDAAQLCQWVRRLAPKMGLVLAEWAATERVIEVGGAAVEGALVSQFFDRKDPSPRYQTFLKAFRERFGEEPGFTGVAGYDTAELALQALEHRRPDQPLKDAFLGEKAFQGLQQTFTLDRFGDTDRKAYLSSIRDGAFVTVR